MAGTADSDLIAALALLPAARISHARAQAREEDERRREETERVLQQARDRTDRIAAERQAERLRSDARIAELRRWPRRAFWIGALMAYPLIMLLYTHSGGEQTTVLIFANPALAWPILFWPVALIAQSIARRVVNGMIIDEQRRRA